MFKKILAPALAGCMSVFSAIPVCAKNQEPQNSQAHAQPAQKNYVTFDLGSSAPWYHVRGPRISGTYGEPKLGSVSFIYLPVPEIGSQQAHDFRFLWNLPDRWTKGTDAAIFTYHSPARGFGAGIEASAGSKNLKVAGRAKAFEDGMNYGELKVLTPHLDASYGIQSEKGIKKGYGNATVNWGKWDDTFSLGMDANETVWNNFSLERSKFGWFSITGYGLDKGNWTTENYFGARDNILRPWFSREVDRFAPKQNIGPKERVDILNFPSYLEFGKWSGEFRADRTGDTTFGSVGIGRAFTKEEGSMKGAKFGFGIGPEYMNKGGNAAWKLSKELYVEVPISSFTVSAYARFRQNEGGFHATLSRKF